MAASESELGSTPGSLHGSVLPVTTGQGPKVNGAAPFSHGLKGVGAADDSLVHFIC